MLYSDSKFLHSHKDSKQTSFEEKHISVKTSILGESPPDYTLSCE